jgi:UrcA family protein
MLRTLTAAALLALAATAAMANTGNEITVTFGDLNLARPADAKILADRLQVAASQACRNVMAENPAGFSTEKAMRECMTSAIDIAIARIEGRLDKAVRANLPGASRDIPTPELIGLKN